MQPFHLQQQILKSLLETHLYHLLLTLLDSRVTIVVAAAAAAAVVGLVVAVVSLNSEYWRFRLSLPKQKTLP